MLLMLAVVGCVIAVDQASKAIVVARLQEGMAAFVSMGGVRLRHVVNRQHPWGSRRAVLGMTVAWLLVVAGGSAIAAAVEVSWARVALGASIGGATGNLIDGIYRRAVTDFIDLRVWPVFNLADVAIVAGGLLTGWNLLRLA